MITIALALLIVLGVGSLVRAILTERRLDALDTQLSQTSQTLEDLSRTVDIRMDAQQQLTVQLSDRLYTEEKIVRDISDYLEEFDEDVDDLSSTVRTLEKLSTTDPELLQKYSRVFFLNEHYMPVDLEEIDEKYTYPSDKTLSIHADVWPYLEELLEEAEDDRVELMVLSGFRSFDEQSSLKDEYLVRYGTGANTFSADQGYSEHQLGTSVDFTEPDGGDNLDTFGSTEEFKWLMKNAHKYGFVLSYPEDNDYYVYEPWHWRFVGEELARDLRRNDKYLYELEQREIDGYLGDLFD